MTKSGTGSRLYAAAAVTLIAMTAFDSTAFAQQAQPPRPSWTGRFEWTHICVGGGNRDETRGVSDLTLDHDGRGNLTGTLAGSTPERAQTIPSCSVTYVAPGTFSAKLVGSYTPGQDTFSVQAAEGRTTPGRASWACPAGTTVTDQAFFTAYEGPMFRDAFRDLRRQPDGSRKSSGESTFSAGGGTCTTTYTLTLRGNDCFSPDKGFVYYTGPDGAHSDPASNSPVVAKPPVGGRLMFTGKTRGLSGETWFQVGKPGSPTWPQVERPATAWVPASAVSCVRPTVPVARPGPPKWVPPLAIVNPPAYNSDDIGCDEASYVEDFGVFLGWYMFTFVGREPGHKCYEQPGMDQRFHGPNQGTGGRG